MSELAGKRLTEDQVLLIAKAFGERRCYENRYVLSANARMRSPAAAWIAHGINPATLSTHMKELEIVGLVELVGEGTRWGPCLTAASIAGGVLTTPTERSLA